MKRKNAKELLPLLQAFAEGKTIQYKIEGVIGWFDTDEIDFKSKKISYRIKPESEPKYRPFKSVEECWCEMQKHQPFGWLKSKESLQLNSYEIGEFSDWDYRFNTYTFADGTPYGIKEE